MVVTKFRTFFNAISSEKIEIEGESIFGIFTKAPIYKVMQGLKKGDKFECNGTAFEIEEVN
jgi:hypothetical protein